MWGKLVFNSFRRDARKKAIAAAAVALATALATFLLNWSFNLGDKIQRDLRAYGANILILPGGERLPFSIGGSEFPVLPGDSYLKLQEMEGLKDIFWRNQIVAMAPLLPQPVRYEADVITLVGAELGERDPKSDLRHAAPYLAVDGRWPRSGREVVAGKKLAEKYGWNAGREIALEFEDRSQTFQITGILKSGGIEDTQVIASLPAVQSFTRHEGVFKQLLVSALVTPENALFQKHRLNPRSLTPEEFERFSCTPFIANVSADIVRSFHGAEARVVRQVSRTEEKISQKMNWLMLLVTLAALVAASLTMTSTTTAMILERKKELALMKAIGSHNAFIAFYLFSEIFLLGALGSLGGYGLGSGISILLSRFIFETALEMKWAVLPVVGFVGVLIILCGSIWPLRQATALQPSVALKDL
jgi:putative ABC transport system permease protein